MSGTGFDPGLVFDEDEEEEKTSEQIAAETMADIEFWEQNTQLPETPPPPSLSDIVFEEQNTQLPEAEPPPPPPPSLEEQVFMEQNTQLPSEPDTSVPPWVTEPAPRDPLFGPEPPADIAYGLEHDVADVEVRHTGPEDQRSSLLDDLEGRIQDEEEDLSQIDQSLDLAIPFDQLQTMGASDLEEYYETTGLEPEGPLAGLNEEIARKNDELSHVTFRLERMNPDEFTTNAEINRWNRLIEEHESITSEINSLTQEYERETGGLVDRWDEHYRTLFGGDPGQLDTDEMRILEENIFGERPEEVRQQQNRGLIGQYEDAQMFTGLTDEMLQGEGLVDPAIGGYRAKDFFSEEELMDAGIDPNQFFVTGLEIGATPGLGREMREMLDQGLVKPASVARAQEGILYELTTAGEDAVSSQRRLEEQRQEQVQRLQLGTTSQDIREFRDDPGFQEFASDLTTTPAIELMGEEAAQQVIDQFGLGISPDELRIGARVNPYGAELDAVPTNAAFRNYMSSEPVTDTFGRLESLFAAPFYPLKPGFELLDEHAPGVLDAMETYFDYQEKAVATGLVGGANVLGQGFTDRGLTTGIGDIWAHNKEEGSVFSSMDLPWYLAVPSFGAVLVADPLNLVTGGTFRSAAGGVSRAARASRGAVRSQNFMRTIDDALRFGTRADSEFLLGTRQLSSTNRSIADNWRYARNHQSFRQAAKEVFSLPDAQADIFADRITTRIHTRPEAEWSDILNEEVGRAATRRNQGGLDPGRPVDSRDAARFNRILEESRAFNNLQGTEFWRDGIGVQTPRVHQDTPAWREGREQVIRDPQAWWDVAQDTPIDQLVAVGFDSSIVVDQRWGQFIDTYGSSTTIPGSKVQFGPDFILPGKSAHVSTNRPVSDLQMQILDDLAKSYDKPLSKMPRTENEFMNELHRVTKTFSEPRILVGSTNADSVVQSAHFRALTEGAVGRVSRGIKVHESAMPVTPADLADATKFTLVHQRNLFDELLDPSLDPVTMGPPASRQRYRAIKSRLPATEAQMAELRKLSSKLGKPVSDAQLRSMRWKDVTDLTAQLRRETGGKKSKESLKDVASYYEPDAHRAYIRGREVQAGHEFSTFFTDLLTPIERGGPYGFTRGRQMPDGVTQAGWLRMSQDQIIDLFRTAPEEIMELPHYGPLIRRIGMVAGELTAPSVEHRAIRGGAGQVLGTLPVPNRPRSALRGEVDVVLDEIMQTLPHNVPLHETKFVHDWLTKKFNENQVGAPRRQLRPDSINLNKPEWHDLDRVGSELNALRAYQAAVHEQADQVRGFFSLTGAERRRFRGAGDRVPGERVVEDVLDFDQIAQMPKRDAVRHIIDHFKNPDTMLTLEGFRDMARQLGLGARGKPLDIETIVDHIHNLHRASGNLTRQMTEWHETFSRLAKRLDPELDPGDLQSKMTRMGNGPRVNQFAQQLQQNYNAYVSASPVDPTVRRSWKDDSTVEIAALAQKSTKPAWDHTPKIIDPTFEMPMERDAFGTPRPVAGAPRPQPRSFGRGAWSANPELVRLMDGAFQRYSENTLNTVSPKEMADRLTPERVKPADSVSQALVIMAHPRNEAAKLLNTTEAEIRRLRSEINTAFSQLTESKRAGGARVKRPSPKKLSEDARSVLRTSDLVHDVLDAHDRVRGLPESAVRESVEMRGGRVHLPSSFGRKLSDWIAEQQKLYVKRPELGEVGARSAKAVRRVGGEIAKGTAMTFDDFMRDVVAPTLDYMVFGVTPGETMDRLFDQLGPDAARFVMPVHQRPVMAQFDPYSPLLNSIDWTTQGRAFDWTMRQFYDPDEVWGNMSRKFSPTGMAQITNMSRGIAIGDYTSYIGHTVYRNVAEIAKHQGIPLHEIYDDIMDHMDQIVDGGPTAQILYGEMFENSEELGRWLRWARQDRGEGITNWDMVKESWGELTPHMSISRMPDSIFARIFEPDHTGPGFRDRKAVYKARKGRSPVAQDLKALDDFVYDRLDLSDLTPDEMLEARYWQDVLRPKWETEVKPHIRRGVDGDFYRGIHIEDLDAWIFPDEALDVFDAQKFVDRMGTRATEIEHKRLGYDSSQVNPMIKATHFIKRTLGTFWLRFAPRYIINNIFGNWASVLLNQLRPDSARGIRLNRRVWNSIQSKHGSVMKHRTMAQGIAGTEMGKDLVAPRGLAALSPEERAKRLDRVRDSMQDRPRGHAGPLKRIASWPGKPVRALLNTNAMLTDLFEIDGRSRVFTNEFNHHYNQAWESGVSRLSGLDESVREAIQGDLELADISTKLTQANVDESTRYLVYRTHNAAISEANLKAYHRTREVMRDYQMRTRYDNLMDIFFPYHFWTTKNALFVSQTVKDRPATLLAAMKIYDEWSEQWEGMPESVRNKSMPFTVPEQVPFLGGKEVALRVNNMTNPAFFPLIHGVGEARDAWELYEDTTLSERLFRTFVGMGSGAWGDFGYAAGPHWDIIASVLGSDTLDRELREKTSPQAADYFAKYFANPANTFLKPQGFDTSLLPLGGLESVLMGGTVPLIDFNPGKTMVPGTNHNLRALYALGNKKVRGTPWTQYEMNIMGKRHLFGMMLDGELGEITVNEDEQGNVTYDISEEVDENWNRLQDMIISGDVEGLENDPLGKELLDRHYGTTARDRGLNYATAMSYTEVTEELMLAYQANDTYGMLMNEDEFIPTAGNTAGSESKIEGLNEKIADAQEDRDRYIRHHDYSPDALATAEDRYKRKLESIYDEAEKDGLWIPQRQGRNPNSANEWAFGSWNDVTKKYEGAHAPWLRFIWAANDDPAEMRARQARDKNFERRIRQSEAIGEAIKESQERRGRTRPYYNDLEEIDRQYQLDLRSLNERDLPEPVRLRLEDELHTRRQEAKGRVYERAEANGISLAGDDTKPPFQTARWYQAADTTNGDMRLLYEQAGMGIPRGPTELLTLDQIVTAEQKKDQREAHTNWAMDRVIESMNLDPYLPGTNKPNPKYQTDGRFDQEKWEQDLKRHSGDILKEYGSFVSTWRMQGRPPLGDDQEAERRIQLLARNDIEFEDFFSYARDTVLPQQTQWEILVNAATDDVFSSKTSEEREEKIQKYRENLQYPGFMRWEETGGAARVDMDEVATTLQDFYVRLEGQAQEEFEDEYGDILTGEEDGKVVDPEKLNMRKVTEIGKRYDIEVPSIIDQWNLTAGRQAIEDTWYELSSEQRQEWAEAFSSDEYEGVILSETGFDDDGEPYTFTTIDVEQLSPEQVSEIVNEFQIPLRGTTTNELLEPDNPDWVPPSSPRYTELLEKAEFDKETQKLKGEFATGELFLDNEEDLRNWRSFYEIRDEHGDLYDAAKQIKDETGLTWKELEEQLEDRPAEGGEGMTLKEFVVLHNTLMDDYDMPRLWDQRAAFMNSEHGQSIAARDPEHFKNYYSDLSGTERETEAFKDEFRSGELFLQNEVDQNNWQAFYDFIQDNSDLYSAAQEVREQTGMTWKDMAEQLENRKSDTGGMTLKEFAVKYIDLIDEYDMGRLWDERAKFMNTEFGQSLIARDPEYFARYVSEDTGGGSAPGGSGGGGFGGGGGGRRTAGPSRPVSSSSVQDLSGDVREIFRLDTGMMEGTVGDAQARFDIAEKVAKLVDSRLSVLSVGFSPELRELFARLYLQRIANLLGESPTLETWMDVLSRFQGGGGKRETQPTPALREQAEYQPQQEDLPADAEVEEEVAV